ncbi:MAG: MMPL family transporter [Pseudomonadota bacterium]|nr:MAG: MMPL family transporter [Pseudomonadota bacterium]
MSKQRLTAIALWLAFLASGAYFAVAQTPVVTDLTAFLPRSDTSQTHRLLGELQQGPASRLVLIAIAGDTQEHSAALSKQLAADLRANPLFVRIANGERAKNLAGYERLLRYRYLLSPREDAQRFTTEALRSTLRQRLRELASPLGMLDKPLLASDPTGEARAMVGAWMGAGGPARRYGVWFTADGSRALLLVETRAAGFDIDVQQQVIDDVHAAFDAARTTHGGASDAKLELSGPAIFAVKSRDRIRGEAQLLSIAASVVVLIILVTAYRSARILLLGAAPLFTAITAGIAAVGAVFGHIHGITLAFGITLLGVAIDYPIHLFSHLRASYGVLNSLLRIWPTMRTGVLTSVVGYLAMTTTDFAGLTQLGLFAICGLLAAAATTRWVLPAVLPGHWAPHAQPPALATRLLRHLPAARSTQRTALTLWVVALAVLFVATPPVWESDLAALSPVPAAERQLDGHLRSELGAPEVTHLVVIRDGDVQAVLQRSEELSRRLQRLVDAGSIDGFDAPNIYLPSVVTQQRRQHSLPDATTLRRALDAAMQDTPFRRGSFEPFVAAVAESRSLAPLRPADLAGTPPGLRLESLLHAQEGTWTALVLLSGVRDHAGFAAWFAQQDVAGARYFDIKTETNRLVVEYRNAALARLAIGAALIVALLWPALRNAGRLLRVITPVGMAIVIDLLALTLLGERLSLFHLVSLLLVVGIGLDYSLFFSRPGDDRDTRARTLHAVLVCAGSTVAVFGILALSDIPVLHAIGTTVAIGVFATLAAAMVLAPQPEASARNNSH